MQKKYNHPCTVTSCAMAMLLFTRACSHRCKNGSMDLPAVRWRRRSSRAVGRSMFSSGTSSAAAIRSMNASSFPHATGTHSTSVLGTKNISARSCAITLTDCVWSNKEKGYEAYVIIKKKRLVKEVTRHYQMCAKHIR